MADDEQDEPTLIRVANKALSFGRAAAQPIGEETFQDPVMHHYFLLFMSGVVDVLGEDQVLDEKLDDIDKKRAMANMLMTFGTASADRIVDMVKLLDDSHDESAQNIKAQGREAARAWAWGKNGAATSRFHELMKDPENFPREVEQVLKSKLMDSIGNSAPDGDLN